MRPSPDSEKSKIKGMTGTIALTGLIDESASFAAGSIAVPVPATMLFAFRPSGQKPE